MEEDENMTALVYRMDDTLKKYRDSVMDIGGDFTNEDCTGTSWSWANAVLFSVTIISTIGYGHIAPGTWEGQIVCICYAVVGLPIFGVFLSLLGDLLADKFLGAYKKFSTRFLTSACCKSADIEDDDDGTRPPSSAGFTSPDPKSPFSPQEVISTRIGRDNDSALTLHQIFPLEGVGDTHKSPHIYDNPKHLAKPDTYDSFSSTIYEKQDAKPEDMNEENEAEDKEEEQITVPLTVSVFLMASYLGVGALMFAYFEGWGPMEGAYFSFITLSTIGFGDFVPGSEADAVGTELKMLCAAIYIMFGMALLAMCFNLMQEKVVRKINWIMEYCSKKKHEE